MNQDRIPILKTDALAAKVEERNNKPTFKEQVAEANRLADAIEPDHYRNGDKDLFDEWHERFYYSEKMFTGREVFIEIMKSVAERYVRRYPNKNAEDLQKGIYTLERLKEYEELEE